MDSSGETRFQYVVVMRHGDRIDNFDPTWMTTAERPWDPPLIDRGKVRAFHTGRALRNQLGFPIHRVCVSPFLRCIQTASEVVAALCADIDDPHATSSSSVHSLDPSKLKVSIEYGLCEMLSREAIRPELAPKDKNFSFNIPELEAMLPRGTVDHSMERVYKEMPKWEETPMGSRTRYAHILKALADKHPTENLLLVTHGEAVGVAVSAFRKDTIVYAVDYCAYSLLKRPVLRKQELLTVGDFEVPKLDYQTGIGFIPSSSLSDDTMETVVSPFMPAHSLKDDV